MLISDHADGHTIAFGHKFGELDRAGLGVDTRTNKVFATLNGDFLGFLANATLDPDVYFPSMSAGREIGIALGVLYARFELGIEFDMYTY